MVSFYNKLKLIYPKVFSEEYRKDKKPSKSLCLLYISEIELDEEGIESLTKMKIAS